MLQRIGILCSGGDAPGMNAFLRAAVRSALDLGLAPYGIERGWSGLLSGDLRLLDSHAVSGIINRGGTMLRTARCPEFRAAEGRQRALRTCREHGLDALVVCGGDGTFAGALELHEESGLPIAAAPGTIDNDLVGTDYTIGFQTAVATAVEAADKIRDTADSHDRVFVVEVMGRESGSIALQVAVAAGAEVVLLPERPEIGAAQAAELLARARQQGKKSMLVIVAEGAGTGAAVAETISASEPNLDVRASVLGYIQRGGVPGSDDRVLATRLGYGAVHALVDLGADCAHHIGEISGHLVRTPLPEVVGRSKPLPLDLLTLVDVTAGLRVTAQDL
ncbi:MAG TPA: 6-phosphofructokinase [Armatimonadetes bacterium]|nr:6-phosphofructokinase [Armatimonadota bacterium]